MRPGPRRFGPGEVALLVAVALAVAHHLDHVLRADYSGWPFTSQVTAFTASLLLYPVLAAAFLLRRRPWARVVLVAVVLGALQVAHMFLETPADQYGTWADGTSSAVAALGRPNLLGVASPALGVAAVAVSVLLSLAVAVALVLLSGDLGRLRRLGRAAATAMLALLLVADLGYGWASASTDRSRLARMIVWQGSDVLDYRRFPARPIRAHPPVYRFRRRDDCHRVLTRTGRGPGPVRDWVQLRPLARTAGRAGPPPVNPQADADGRDGAGARSTTVSKRPRVRDAVRSVKPLLPLGCSVGDARTARGCSWTEDDDRSGSG
jgi:hypothetical protein